MKIIQTSFALCAVVVSFAAVVIAGEGSEMLNLPAEKGVIAFPHWKHQSLVKDDCSKCHSDDPGKIKELDMDWGHKVCRGCHINETVEDKKGPVICFGCHTKP
jgi:predicted CXXCH cytochrome family protein